MSVDEQLQEDRSEERQTLREMIELKFGSIRRFCEISDRDYHSFRNMLNRDPISEWQIGQIRQAYNDVMSVSDKVLDNEISHKEARVLFQAWIDSKRSISSLAIAIAKPRTSVHDVIHAKVKKKNDVYRALVKYLHIFEDPIR